MNNFTFIKTMGLVIISNAVVPRLTLLAQSLLNTQKQIGGWTRYGVIKDKEIVGKGTQILYSSKSTVYRLCFSRN